VVFYVVFHSTPFLKKNAPIDKIIGNFELTKGFLTVIFELLVSFCGHYFLKIDEK